MKMGVMMIKNYIAQSEAWWIYVCSAWKAPTRIAHSTKYQKDRLISGRELRFQISARQSQ